MNEWMVRWQRNWTRYCLLPPEKVDALTKNEDIDKDQVDRHGLPNVCGNIQIQTNQTAADSENDDVDSIEESSSSSKTDQPITNVLANGKLKTVKNLKNVTMEELAGKQPHEAFEKYVNTELEKMVVKETNHYAAQKNKNSTLTVTDIETFNAVLILTGYHLLPRTRMFWETQEDIHLLNFLDIYESISRNESEDIKRYIHFADNNHSDTKDRYAKVRKLYDIMNKNLQ